MSATREIYVLQGGEELVRQPLDLVRLPDGGEAAKWGGLAFPVLPEDRIEITGQGFMPAQCRPWSEEPPRLNAVAATVGTDSYIFVEGSAQVCRDIVRRLADAGFEILRSGPNLSGGPGDWFIRLGNNPPDAAAKLPELLAEQSSPATEADTPLRERLLVQALIASQASQATLKTELQRARDAAGKVPSASLANSALTDSLDAMAARLAEAEAEIEELQTRLEMPPAVPPARSTRLEAELKVATAALLPRLDFIGSSMRFIAVELSDRAILWKALAELERRDRGLPPAWKALSGHPGWWERHFSTGQDNQGRIYAKMAGTPQRLQVLVSHKQDQSNDLRRIARM